MTGRKRLPGLAAGPRYAEHLRREAWRAQLDSMTSDEIIEAGTAIAKEAIDKRIAAMKAETVAEKRRDSLADARAQRHPDAMKKVVEPRIRALLKSRQWTRDSAAEIAAATGADAQYVRQLRREILKTEKF